MSDGSPLTREDYQKLALAEREENRRLKAAAWKLVHAEQPILLGSPLDDFYVVLCAIEWGEG